MNDTTFQFDKLDNRAGGDEQAEEETPYNCAHDELQQEHEEANKKAVFSGEFIFPLCGAYRR